MWDTHTRTVTPPTYTYTLPNTLSQRFCQDITNSIDVSWVLLCAFLIFWMKCGFMYVLRSQRGAGVRRMPLVVLGCFG